MNANSISVELILTDGSGAVKARADVRIELPGGILKIFGFSIIQKDGKSAWVGFPSKPGKTPGKYFPTFDAEGEIHGIIARAILEAYQTAKAA